jgi:hypothetical protein
MTRKLHKRAAIKVRNGENPCAHWYDIGPNLSPWSEVSPLCNNKRCQLRDTREVGDDEKIHICNNCLRTDQPRSTGENP